MVRILSAVPAVVCLLTCGFVSGQQLPSDRSSFECSLKTLDGDVVSIQPDVRVPATVVCFLGAECPLVRQYGGRLSDMSRHFADRGVRFVGINSNRQDTAEDIRDWLRQYPLSFPLTVDDDNSVADRYGATRTPEVFVLDQQLQLRYRGRIDDQYVPGIARPQASRDDLKLAIEQILAGQPVEVAQTEPVGCMIGKRRRSDVPATAPDATVTFSQHVSRMLHRHCVECHREGDIGPFPMTSYHDVVGWADTMLEVMDNGRMPPWHADPAVGHFRNSRAMPEADRRILKDWVAAGMPEGNPADLPAPRQYAEGWQLPRDPDLTLAMSRQPYAIPAEGTVEYQYFVVDPGFTEDRWVTAAQVIPGNRSVVHHAIVFIRPPDGTPFRGIGWLTAYVPGQRTVTLPPGHGRRIPAGSKLVFQMHYTTNGAPQTDRTQVGIVFGEPDQISHEVITLVGIDQEFEIPPHVAQHEVSGQVRWFPKQGRLLAVAPHMHLRGRQFRLSAVRGEQSEPLLNVPNYDFNWQHSYEFEQPVDLAGVDDLKFTVTFDNSAGNPFNPDPSQWVNWGDQTWEEMAVAFFEVSEPRAPSQPDTSEITEAARQQSVTNQDQNIERFVTDFFERLDLNQDGVVLYSEAPIAVRSNFRRFDPNNDRQATRDEVRRVAEERFRD